jgi:hypothetical protein
MVTSVIGVRASRVFQAFDWLAIYNIGLESEKAYSMVCWFVALLCFALLCFASLHFAQA